MNKVEIFEWLKKRKYETTIDENNEYTLYFELSMPEILMDFHNYCSQKKEIKNSDNLGKDIFILLSDSDGTTFSQERSFGIAVTSEEEAKRFVKEAKLGYTRSYEKIRIFENKDDGIEYFIELQEEIIKGFGS